MFKDNIVKNYICFNVANYKMLVQNNHEFCNARSTIEIFGIDKMVIVTQDYHLHRALYIAKSFGIEAYGVSANPREYYGQTYRDIREILARDKDFVLCIFKPKPTYLGEAISVNGSGDVTNDK